MACASLDELLAKMRGGEAGEEKRPVSSSSTSSRLPPRGTYMDVQELDDDDWEGDNSDAIVYIAPKQFATCHVSTTHAKIVSSKGSTTTNDIKAYIDHAISLKRKALDMEKSSAAYRDALDLYTEAGCIFLRAGRASPPGFLQNALKMEAFSLLIQAERLERWSNLLMRGSCPGSALNCDSHVASPRCLRTRFLS
ncbi:hypothetical protein H310_14872 [Aphanomyces invadans]|uniref:MIT domain-containing protein n=1 Tax=Aphanomyces invadans TaxID=157072 RepID=A0A024T8L4_9STRA|nr:hypothetical protein H310_14872 [Aphanomyces invadans]ETV90329.1 hypothetical protein H310_14872 [Aphanomyces invadans]|eukprot:XP_008881056.1 hypothetical protein H310_14872 [Aphanomyces invadans]